MDYKNIDYFLFLKKKYVNILSYLTEIMNSYEEISSYNDDYLIQYNKYKNEVYEIKYLIANVNNSICETCEHIFVEDEIDITPDKSQKIEYCKICEYSRQYGFTLI
jgi:hypothetical protein